MEHTGNQMKHHRVISLLLTILMVFSLIPMEVSAANASLEITNSAGEAVTTFVEGEPIYITASSDISGDWIGVYEEAYFSGNGSGYTWWYYVNQNGYTNGTTYNLYETEPWAPSEVGKSLKAGKYYVNLYSANITKVITVVAPSSSESSLEVEADSVTYGDSIRVKATNYNDGAWVGLYSGTKTLDDTFGNDYRYFRYTNGYHGTWLEIPNQQPGEYTVVLFDDSGYGAPVAVAPVEVTESGVVIELIKTDKQEYVFGEPINVTTNFSGSNAWVGIYKKGETYNPNSGGAYSIYWYYIANGSSTKDLIDASNTSNGSTDVNGRAWEFIAGDYTVSLFNNDSYVCEASVDITITTEEKSRQETSATCETPGQIVITYTDNTIKTITSTSEVHTYANGTVISNVEIAHEELNATGHDWSDWKYNGADAKSHTRTCQTDGTHTETDVCAFDEGVVTKEPTAAENGIKLFTCSTCDGTYTQEISQKEVDRTEVIAPAGCETEGTLRTYYTDGTYLDSAITPSGHDWADEWTYDAANGQHYKVCGNDASHIKDQDTCDFVPGALTNGKLTHTCSVCTGSYVQDVLSTDKTTYKFGDEINVTIDYVGDRAWVGLYKNGETYNPASGGAYSIYWYYITNGKTTCGLIQTSATSNNNADVNGRVAAGDYKAGEYKVVLFDNDSYEVVTSVDITITKEETGRHRSEPTCTTDGEIVITYSDGSTDKITAASDPTLKATEHSWGSWVYDSETKTHSRVCGNDNAHTESDDCSFDEGREIEAPSGTENGVMEYTCTVCFGTYTEEFSDKEVDYSEEIQEATCQEAGTLRTWYKDGTYLDSEIKKLTHEWSDWTYNGVEEKNHSRVCTLNGTTEGHKETEDCNFGDPEISGGKATYECGVCKGTYITQRLATDKTSYELDDKILVTAVCDNENSWVGLYKKGEKYDPNNGGVCSIAWYYVTSNASGIHRSGSTIDITASEFKNTDRVSDSAITNGEYKVVLFGDGGYTNILDTIEITVSGSTSQTEFDLQINGQSYQTGDSLTLEEDAPVKMIVSAEGVLGDSWVGVYNKKMSIDVDFSGVGTSQYWDYIRNINGNEIDLRTVSAALNLTYGDYTIVIYGDGGYTDARKVVNFTISQKESDSDIVKEPTCTTTGTRRVVYDDGRVVYVPMEALGHDVSEWVYNINDKAHTGVCQRSSCTKTTIVEPCQFDEGEVIEVSGDGLSSIKLYTCQICGGTYTEGSINDKPVDTTVVRVYGSTRYETAMNAADIMKEKLGVEKFEAVVVTSGTGFADALAGSYLAIQKNAPILMANGKNTAEVHQYIKENLKSGGTVYILGGTDAVPEALETGLDGFEVKRIWGATRYETNLEILKAANVTGGEVIVCTGKGFADSLSASAAGRPILLVADKLTDEQKEFLTELSVKKFFIIGGEAAVSGEMEAELRKYGRTERIGGQTRYETSVMVADRFIDDPDSIVLAYSLNYPDGLCGGPLAACMNAPLILTATDKEAMAAEYASVYGLQNGIVLGGQGLISDDAANAIFGRDAGTPISD